VVDLLEEEVDGYGHEVQGSHFEREGAADARPGGGREVYSVLGIFDVEFNLMDSITEPGRENFVIFDLALGQEKIIKKNATVSSINGIPSTSQHCLGQKSILLSGHDLSAKMLKGNQRPVPLMYASSLPFTQYPLRSGKRFATR